MQDQLLAMLRDQLVAIACGAVFLFIGCLPVALPRFAIAGKRGSLFGWEYGAQVLREIRHWQPSSMAKRDDITLIGIDML